MVNISILLVDADYGKAITEIRSLVKLRPDDHRAFLINKTGFSINYHFDQPFVVIAYIFIDGRDDKFSGFVNKAPLAAGLHSSEAVVAEIACRVKDWRDDHLSFETIPTFFVAGSSNT